MKPCLYQHILSFHLISSALSDLGELSADPSSPTPHPRALICGICACGAQGDPGTLLCPHLNFLPCFCSKAAFRAAEEGDPSSTPNVFNSCCFSNTLLCRWCFWAFDFPLCLCFGGEKNSKCEEFTLQLCLFRTLSLQIGSDTGLWCWRSHQ